MITNASAVVDPYLAACAVLRHDLGLGSDDHAIDLIDREYVLRYAALSAAAHRRNALPTADRELVQLALCASIQIYDAAGVELHTRRALAAGASYAQVLATRVETLGTHTMSFAAPMLIEELERAGQDIGPDTPERRDSEQRLETRLRELRGHWNEAWRPMMRLDPEFLIATHELLACTPGVIEPKLREFIYTAFDVSTAHLYPGGARSHMRNALALGATADEIMEVCELTALVAYRSFLLLLPCLSASRTRSPERIMT